MGDDPQTRPGPWSPWFHSLKQSPTQYKVHSQRNRPLSNAVRVHFSGTVEKNMQHLKNMGKVRFPLLRISKSSFLEIVCGVVAAVCRSSPAFRLNYSALHVEASLCKVSGAAAAAAPAGAVADDSPPPPDGNGGIPGFIGACSLAACSCLTMHPDI